MRVITGEARGRRLQTPPGLDTRPTSGKVKEAVFSMIQFEIEGARVLDLFAGSGQMGIEALSRGAAHCVFVDSAGACREVMRENLKHTKLADRARVVTGDALSWLRRCEGQYDIVMMDPPYDSGVLQKALTRAADAVNERGIVICEAAKDAKFPEQAGHLRLVREAGYGKTKIALYRGEQTND